MIAKIEFSSNLYLTSEGTLWPCSCNQGSPRLKSSDNMELTHHRHLATQFWGTDSIAKAGIWPCENLPFQNGVNMTKAGFIVLVKEFSYKTAVGLPVLHLRDLRISPID